MPTFRGKGHPRQSIGAYSSEMSLWAWTPRYGLRRDAIPIAPKAYACALRCLWRRARHFALGRSTARTTGDPSDPPRSLDPQADAGANPTHLAVRAFPVN